jgi:hypothetical protein
MPVPKRAASDHEEVKRATLAADAVIQGIPCRAGALVEFSEPGGGLEHCTLSRRTQVTAEINDDKGRKSTRDLACAADQEISLWTFERRLLERCVLAETATIGTVACAGGKEIVLDGDGLDSCTLASAQRIGPFDLAAETLVKFTSGRLDRFDMPAISAPVALSDIMIPSGTVVSLCDGSSELGWLEVPEDRYISISGVKLTGRLNFDCGKFQYGSLFEDTELRGRRLPRGAAISADDMLHPH